MEIVDSNVIPWTLISGHREGIAEFKLLFRGRPGLPSNFEFALTRIPESYFAPRHRHNFDQIRYVVSGVLNYAPGKDLVEGSVGYFPEGTYYGPQNVQGPPVTLILQFGGASGQGFLSYEDIGRAFKELSELGNFTKGVYRTTDEQRKVAKNVDAYQAIWEHVNGRPLHYPNPCYNEPIIMYPKNYRWHRMPGETPVSQKLLGVFSDAATEIAFFRWQAGAKHLFKGGERARLLFVTEGELTAGGHTVSRQGAMFLEKEESAILEATANAEALVIGMPLLETTEAEKADHDQGGIGVPHTPVPQSR